MKTKKFKAIITLVMIVLMLGCIDQAKAGAPSELARIGDFSIDLVDIKREKNTTTLHFAITKVGDTGSGHQSLQVSLIDDHGNEYSGDLDINLEGASDVVLNALPKGFTYVDMVGIFMPKIAPIETIKLVDIKEIAFNKVKFGRPQFMKNFGHLAITKGQSVAVSKWLSFTMEKILPAPGHWELPITIENKEYNPLPAGVKVAAQYSDGTISWSQDESITASALSKTSVKVVLPIPIWVKDEPPQPKVLLNVYSDKSFDKGKMILKIFPITPSGLPPLVGQGPKEIEDAFLNAYKRNGGQERMGNPLNFPRWFTGADQPKDENDVLIQEFSAVSDFGKSMIFWDRQGNTTKAYILHGAILEKYLKLGGPSSSLGKLISDQMAVQNSMSYFETKGAKGNYNIFEQGTITCILSGPHSKQVSAVLGKIYERWKERGSVKSRLGFPTKDEQSTTSGAHGSNTTGRVQGFEGGHIYYLTNGNYADHAFIMCGNIDDFYMKEEQGSIGWLGFPMQDCYWPRETIRGPCDFEAGYIASSEGKALQAFHYEPGRIAFVSERDGKEGIYVMDVSGRKQVNLTENLPSDNKYRTFAWSPDGSQIVFECYWHNKFPSKIYLMDADGTNLRFLVEGQDPSWFPDGSKIIYSKKGKIFTIKPDGTKDHRVTPDKESTEVENFKYLIKRLHAFPTVSPDGTKIAFGIGNWRYGHAYDVYVMNLDGTNLRRLSKSKSGSHWYAGNCPSWSPNGQKIVFRGDSGNSIGGRYGGWVFIAPANTYTVPNQLGVWCYGKLSWSPDGTAIAYSNKNNQICTIQVDTKIVRCVTQKGQNWDPAWYIPHSKNVGKVEEKINLTYSVDQFTPESATGTAFSLPVRKEGNEGYFPWVASHINTAWSIILPITFQVTDSSGNPISDAQIFMGRQKLGLTDNSVKFTYKYVVRIPKRENKIIKLPFSAKKNEISTSIDIPFSWSVLETTSIHIATKEDLDRYTKILYQYELLEPSLPLPEGLGFLKPFLPLLKTVHDLKKGPQIGDRIDIFLIEHRINGKEPVAWAYWEQIKRGEDTPYFATGWIISPEDKQRILNTYFLIKKA